METNKKYYIVSKDLMKSSAYRYLRSIIFDIQGHKCLCCGSGDDLELDHIKPKSLYPELCFDIFNMQILCNKCNAQKSNKYENDYRSDEQINELVDICNIKLDSYKIIENNLVDKVFTKVPHQIKNSSNWVRVGFRNGKIVIRKNKPKHKPKARNIRKKKTKRVRTYSQDVIRILELQKQIGK